jgi:REP element-mobilizing transposase RayT
VRQECADSRAARLRLESSSTVQLMPRPLRIQAPDTLYHVTGNATDRWHLFTDDVDRARYISIVASVVEKYEWSLYALVLMGTHDHLMFRTKHANIAAGMQALNSRYATDFNRRHARPGHLFRARYGARLVEEPGHLLWCLRYFARNPVEAGLCDSPLEWRWSSYPGLVGVGEPWPFVDADEVLSLFARDRESAITLFRDLVEEPKETC